MATLSRWDPLSEIGRIQDQFARWVGRESPFASAFVPAVDIYEDKDAIVVRAEVPGVEAGDVSINVEGNVLTISGERKLEEEDKRDGYQRIERLYGTFSRSFALPNTVDADNVDATMADGVLRVRIPKRATPEPRRIEVKPNESHKAPSQKH
ncbi:MAG TPA: Hsp20/alpha crystallin family protein [Polyangiaceae bacterium]|nr:Hsp20/alpha crystallin family protein [Polyangiaceae bacterium]